MTKLYVYSLDYDGCMAEKNFEKMIEANPMLIEEIADSINAGNEATICVGSNRQGIHKDHYNSCKSSCFSVFTAYPDRVEQIKKKIKDSANKSTIKFDSFLTIDAQQGINPGTNFNQYQHISYITDKRKPTLDDVEDIKNMPKNKTDESKISTLYAQMHLFAFLHPNKEIKFIFKDDQKKILEQLHQFYSHNQNLIPGNITLKLEQKISNEVKAAIDIKIDKDKFRESDAWDAITGGKAEPLTSINGAGHLDSDFFTAFNGYQLEKEISKRMHVFVDEFKAVEQNTLTSNHEFQAFNGAMRHARDNVAITRPLCTQNSAPYDHHSDTIPHRVNPKKRDEIKFANESKDYNKAKENIIMELYSFKEGYQSNLTGLKNYTTRNAKINIALGAIALLVGGSAIAAILLTVPFSLPAIIGVSLLGFAVASAVWATSTRARIFLKDASSMKKLINFLDNSVTHKKNH